MSAESVSRTVSHAIADARVPGSDGQCVPTCNGAPTLEHISSGAHERANDDRCAVVTDVTDVATGGICFAARTPPAKKSAGPKGRQGARKVRNGEAEVHWS